MVGRGLCFGLPELVKGHHEQRKRRIAEIPWPIPARAQRDGSLGLPDGMVDSGAALRRR
jgi:hypothetical protein